MRGLTVTSLTFVLFLSGSSSQKENLMSREKRDYYGKSYAKWSALSTRRAAILETLEKVDNEFHAAMDGNCSKLKAI
jgi:hypothetical protein